MVALTASTPCRSGSVQPGPRCSRLLQTASGMQCVLKGMTRRDGGYTEEARV